MVEGNIFFARQAGWRLRDTKIEEQTLVNEQLSHLQMNCEWKVKNGADAGTARSLTAVDFLLSLVVRRCGLVLVVWNGTNPKLIGWTRELT